MGSTVVGQRAGELIGEVSLAMTKGMKAADVALAIHAYPTHSIGLQQVASEIGSAVFRASTVGRIASSLYSRARIVRDHSSLAVDEHEHSLQEAVPMPLVESTEERAAGATEGVVTGDRGRDGGDDDGDAGGGERSGSTSGWASGAGSGAGAAKELGERTEQ